MNFVSHQVKGGLMEKLFKFTAYVMGLVVVCILVQDITQAKMEKLRESQMLSSPDIVTIKTRERQLECLAMNIYREAGHENFEGKVAVAQVTMNRASHPSFPKDVCAVVFQKSVVMDRVICQFSWYCDTAHKARPVNQSAYNESMAVAKKVLLEGFRLDVMKEALYYHANYVNPRWNLEKIGSIGNHIFYKGKN
jgi:spore germination cell wall hydrolase CwlJ-like protein